jgi:hypothetical protein
MEAEEAAEAPVIAGRCAMTPVFKFFDMLKRFPAGAGNLFLIEGYLCNAFRSTGVIRRAAAPPMRAVIS